MAFRRSYGSALPGGGGVRYPRHDCCSVNAVPISAAVQCDRCRRPLTAHEIIQYRKAFKAVASARRRSSPIHRPYRYASPKSPSSNPNSKEGAKQNVLQKLSKDARNLFSQSSMVLQNIEKLKHNLHMNSIKEKHSNKNSNSTSTQTKETISKKNKVNQTKTASLCEIGVGSDSFNYISNNADTQTEEVPEAAKEVPDDLKQIDFFTVPFLNNFQSTQEIYTMSCTNKPSVKNALSEFVKNQMPIESLLADRYRKVVYRPNAAEEKVSFNDSERLISVTDEPDSLGLSGAGELCIEDEAKKHMEANKDYLEEGKMLEKINYLCSALKLQVKYNCMSRALITAKQDFDVPFQNEELFLKEFTYIAEDHERFRAGNYESEEENDIEENDSLVDESQEDKKITNISETASKCVRLDLSCANDCRPTFKGASTNCTLPPSKFHPRPRNQRCGQVTPPMITVAKKHYCSNMDSRLVQPKKISSHITRKHDKPDILIEVKSALSKKSNILNKHELKQVTEKSVIKDKAIGEDTINENGFGDENNNSNNLDDTSNYDAQTSIQKFDDDTSDSGSQDKSMQVETPKIENKSITAVSDTTEECAQAAIPAAIEDKLTWTNPIPDIQDDCTSDKLVMGLYTESDSDTVCQCEEDVENDSSYDTLLTITMKMAEDANNPLDLDPNESSKEICNCVNCEYVSQLELLPPSEVNKQKFFTSVQTSSRSMGGAEDNGEHKAMQTSDETSSKPEKQIDDYDSDYYINQHKRLHEQEEPKQQDASKGKKKRNYIENEEEKDLEDSEIHLVFQNPPDQVFQMSVPTSITELDSLKRDRLKAKKQFKSREFCCWKINFDSDDEDIYNSDTITRTSTEIALVPEVLSTTPAAEKRSSLKSENKPNINIAATKTPRGSLNEKFPAPRNSVQFQPSIKITMKTDDKLQSAANDSKQYKRESSVPQRPALAPRSDSIIVETHRFSTTDSLPPSLSKLTGNKLPTPSQLISEKDRKLNTTHYCKVKEKGTEKSNVGSKQYSQETRNVLGRIGIDVDQRSVMKIPQKQIPPKRPILNQETQNTSQGPRQESIRKSVSIFDPGQSESSEVSFKTRVSRRSTLESFLKDFSDEKVNYDESESDANLTDIIRQVSQGGQQ